MHSFQRYKRALLTVLFFELLLRPSASFPQTPITCSGIKHVKESKARGPSRNLCPLQTPQRPYYKLRRGWSRRRVRRANPGAGR